MSARLPARAAALRELLRELGAGDGDVPAKLEELAAKLAVAPSTLKLARADLVAAGELSVTPSPGRTPSLYRLLQPADNRPTQPADPTGQPADSSGRAQPDELDGPRVRGTTPGLEGVETATKNELDVFAQAPAREAQPADAQPDDARPVEPVVQGVGQAAVGWAVDEQRRLGLPVLLGSMLKKIGDQAKRMSDDGATLERIRAAVETLVAGGHSDLLLADRKASGKVQGVDAQRLAEQVEAVPKRDPVARSREPHTEDELLEALAWIAANWPARAPNFTTPEARAHWHRELRELPIDGIIYGLRVYARRIEAAWPPTPAQVHALAYPVLEENRRRFADYAEQERREAQHAAATANAAAALEKLRHGNGNGGA